jgi:adenylate/guanylate cyclase family protein
MTDDSGRTLVCSVLFLDLVGYSKKAVTEQHETKQTFNRALSEALDLLKRRDRVIVDTGDGAAVVFLGDPEDAMIVGLAMRESAARIPMRMGINLGPVRLMTDLNEQTNVIGDGINVAQRVMSFAGAGQLLVSASYYEVVAHVSDHYKGLFTRVGLRQDKHVREHDVYLVDESIRIGDAPAAAPAPKRAAAAAEPARVADAGSNLMISGGTRAIVQAALDRLVAQGAQVVAPPSQAGAKWYAACSHPGSAQFECTVEKIGLKRLITGPTRQAVADKVADLTAFGAKLVGEIEEIDGKWTAVCDTES